MRARTLFTLLAMASAPILNAQCSYEKNEMDRFTKQRVVVTRARISIKSAAADAMEFRRQGDAYFMDLTLSVGNVPGVCPGDQLMLMLQDSSVVTMMAPIGGELQISNTQYGKLRILHCSYSIDREDLLRMMVTPVQDLRIYYCSTYEDIDISKPVKQRKVMQAVQCLVQAPKK